MTFRASVATLRQHITHKWWHWLCALFGHHNRVEITLKVGIDGVSS